MKQKKLHINSTFLIACLLALNLFSLSAEKRQSTILSNAESAYRDFRYAVAAEYYEDYLKGAIDADTKVFSSLADCYWQMRDYHNALRVYRLLFPDATSCKKEQDLFRMSELLARDKQYKDASEFLSKTEKFKSKAQAYSDKNEINKMLADSSCWKVNLLNINTPYRDFSPFVANNQLYFSSNKPLSVEAKASEWDNSSYMRLWSIPISSLNNDKVKLEKDSLGRKEPLKLKKTRLAGIYECGDNKTSTQVSRPDKRKAYIPGDKKAIGYLVQGLDKVNGNIGGASIDKNNHFYFSANYGKADELGDSRICLMEGTMSTTGVTNIQKLPFGDVNANSVMHPAVNQDGTVLVCTSDKKGGKGNFDLYYAQRKSVGQQWSNLKAFGESINTSGNEVFPNITPNGFLYFSSDLLPGLGGLDMYRIKLQDAIDEKGTPEHLSYPINSSSDDFGWTQQDTTGLKGYFTSDRLNSDDNIFAYTYQPVGKKTYFEGNVLVEQNKKPIQGATVFLYNVAEDAVYVAKTDAKGKYHFPVLTTSQVKVKAVDKRFFDDGLQSNIVYKSHPKDTLQKPSRDLLLDQFKIGFVWKLSKIYYDYNKADIRTDAKPVLDSLAIILKSNPIIVELGSHTDCRGRAVYNQWLSQQRAESAVKYLIAQGIEPSRITAKGYGESMLINRCADGVQCSEDEHQENRRSEVKVTGYTVPQREATKIDLDKFKNGDKINRKDLPANFFDDCK